MIEQYSKNKLQFRIRCTYNHISKQKPAKIIRAWVVFTSLTQLWFSLCVLEFLDYMKYIKISLLHLLVYSDLIFCEHRCALYTVFQIGVNSISIIQVFKFFSDIDTQERSELRTYCASKNLDIVYVIGDGHCIFRSALICLRANNLFEICH
jgi:hypothetical protein